ncbi:MAG: GTPase HflX, partial [Planctomycetota bacterium]
MRETNEKPKRALVAAVHLAGVSDVEFEASLTELRQLAKTLGFEVVHTFTQKRRRFDAAAYLGRGKRQELRRFVRNEPEPADGVPADDEDDGAEDSDGAPH